MTLPANFNVARVYKPEKLVETEFVECQACQKGYGADVCYQCKIRGYTPFQQRLDNQS